MGSPEHGETDEGIGEVILPENNLCCGNSLQSC